MATFEEVRRNIVASHKKSIESLELQYMQHINQLLQMKSLILVELQTKFYDQLNKLHNERMIASDHHSHALPTPKNLSASVSLDHNHEDIIIDHDDICNVKVELPNPLPIEKQNSSPFRTDDHKQPNDQDSDTDDEEEEDEDEDEDENDDEDEDDDEPPLPPSIAKIKTESSNHSTTSIAQPQQTQNMDAMTDTLLPLPLPLFHPNHIHYPHNNDGYIPNTNTVYMQHQHPHQQQAPNPNQYNQYNHYNQYVSSSVFNQCQEIMQITTDNDSPRISKQRGKRSKDKQATPIKEFEPGNPKFDKALRKLRKMRQQNKSGNLPSVRGFMRQVHLGFPKAV